VTVTLKADLQVSTASLRAALQSVYPHRSKVKTGDDLSERRLRLTFAEGTLFVTASNKGAQSGTTALAKVPIIEDSRTTLGKLDADDGPILVDLEAYRSELILQTFKLGGNDSDAQQAIKIHISDDPKDRFIRLTDVGGLWEGDTTEFLLPAPAQMPDVLTVTSRALAEMGADPSAKPLVCDPKMLALFSAAGEAYGAMVEIRAVGTQDSGGFIVKVGPDFVGTIESHHAIDGMGKREAWHMAWLKLLPALKLVAS
jgi:hypothetical protein